MCSCEGQFWIDFEWIQPSEGFPATSFGFRGDPRVDDQSRLPFKIVI